MDERLRFGKGTKRWDKILGVFFSPVFLAIYIIAGFDAAIPVSIPAEVLI